MGVYRTRRQSGGDELCERLTSNVFAAIILIDRFQYYYLWRDVSVQKRLCQSPFFYIHHCAFIYTVYVIVKDRLWISVLASGNYRIKST
jgi:hypothetical protein